MDPTDPLLFPDGFESLLRPFLTGISFIHFGKLRANGALENAAPVTESELCENFLLAENKTDVFDAKAYASQVVSSSDIAPGERAARLAECISLVDSRIRAQVSQHQNELLSQASRTQIAKSISGSCNTARTNITVVRVTNWWWAKKRTIILYAKSLTF